MKTFDNYRPILFATYLLQNNTTIRKTAEHFGYGKSTVHNDINKRLRYINPSLFSETQKLLDVNYNEKHLRGGESTRQKYKKD